MSSVNLECVMSRALDLQPHEFIEFSHWLSHGSLPSAWPAFVLHETAEVTGEGS